MPLANGFLTKDEFTSEYFYEMQVGFSEKLSLFQLNDHPKPKNCKPCSLPKALHFVKSVIYTFI